MILLSMDQGLANRFIGEEWFIHQSGTVAKQNMVLLAISNDFPFWLHINLRTSKLAAWKEWYKRLLIKTRVGFFCTYML